MKNNNTVTVFIASENETNKKNIINLIKTNNRGRNLRVEIVNDTDVFTTRTGLKKLVTTNSNIGIVYVPEDEITNRAAIEKAVNTGIPLAVVSTSKRWVKTTHYNRISESNKLKPIVVKTPTYTTA